MGLNVSVAHPMKIKLIELIGKSKKTDRNDSFHLANLLRMDYLPLRYLRKGMKR